MLMQKLFPAVDNLVVLSTTKDEKIVGRVVSVSDQLIQVVDCCYLVTWAQGFELAAVQDPAVCEHSPTAYTWASIVTCNLASDQLEQKWKKYHGQNTI